MIKGEFDKLDRIAKFNVCAEHKESLTVAWVANESCYVLRCGVGEYPDAVTRQLSLTEAHKAGEPLPETITDNIDKGRRKRAMQQKVKPASEELALLPQADLGTGELIPAEVRNALVKYARKYDLDPYRGHVVIMYSKPYITIDGYLYHAKGTKKPYTLESSPLSDDMRKQYQVPEGQHAWTAKATLTETGASATGLGIVTVEEMEAKSSRDHTKFRSPVVAAHPWQLAQKRAEWQALRRLFPIGESEEKEEGKSEVS